MPSQHARTSHVVVTRHADDRVVAQQAARRCDLAIVFAGVIAWLRWGETPDLWSVLGTLLIFGASLSAVIRRKR